MPLKQLQISFISLKNKAINILTIAKKIKIDYDKKSQKIRYFVDG